MLLADFALAGLPNPDASRWIWRSSGSKAAQVPAGGPITLYGGTTDEGGVRTVEVAEALGLGETTVRKLLGQLKAQGRLQVVRRKVETLDGKQTTVRAYKLL